MPTSLVPRAHRVYGAHPLQLVLVLASFALAAYAIALLGLGALWNPDTWWQSIAVWFLGAAVAHDLLLFPVYAAADRVLSLGEDLRSRRGQHRPAVPVVNYLRIPLLACALITLVFFPGLIRQGAGAYHRATGMTQDVFLRRWLLLCAAILLCGLLAYVVARLRAGPRPADPDDRPAASPVVLPETAAPPGLTAGWAVVVVLGLVVAARRRSRRR